MGRFLYAATLIIGIPLVSSVYYTLSFGESADRVLLTVSTFIFSIFTGFFISRQASRFNRVRENVTRFDGKMSNLYRLSGHLGPELQKSFGDVIKAHYRAILDSRQWDFHFKKKSVTLSKLHSLLDTDVDEENVNKVQNQALGAIIKSLGGCQDVRKQMIALQEERIPHEQWVLIGFFAAILVATVSTLSSTGDIFISLLKAAFVASIFSVIYILYKLNSLNYTERLMGEHSAQDVLDIIEGTK